MELQFTKMHGLGNDFVVLDGIRQTLSLSAQQLRFLADRHFGIGCDQILLVEKAENGTADFRYRIFNANGNEVEQCGNGARCFARFVREQGLTDKSEIHVETMNGHLVLQIEPPDQVTVNIGIPEFTPEKIPFRAGQQAPRYSLQVGENMIEIGSVSLGNPHAILQVEDVETAPVTTLGPLIERHPEFPQGVNAGFMQIVDRRNIAVRVFERGAGETLACGSGACAAMVIGRLWGELDDNIHVKLRGGSLQIRWQGPGTPVYMTGPAESVYKGSINI